jgi:DNA (cytosine-5)-methyltransferase 1
MARIICEVRPKFVFVENSPMLTHRGLGTVLGDLANMGFNAEWGVLGASDIGAKHHRKRIWIVARQQEILSHTNNRDKRWKQQQESNGQKRGNMADNGYGWGQRWGFGGQAHRKGEWDLCAIFNQPEPARMADGVAARLDRNKAIGNGQVPQVAAVAWHLLTERLNNGL